MNTFDERKKAFEAKFLQDEDLKFKLRARRNKKIAVWAAELVGKTNDEKYISNRLRLNFAYTSVEVTDA